jgi:hypothetical protein
MLVAAGLAPLAARAAKDPGYHVGIDPAGPGSDATDHHAVWVNGPAIKVPSNRVMWPHDDVFRREWVMVSRYIGDWDGTFKLARGCTNPAYILADLYDRAREGRLPEPDWVLQDSVGFLDWQMLYDFGRWCDETVVGTGVVITNGSAVHTRLNAFTPRLTVHAALVNEEQIDGLRETLRMHCLSWQSTDPRYRTSWPGISYA